MVKAAARSPFRWWRGFLGVLLTCLIVVPFMMGADVEKYLRGWTAAVNQRSAPLHLEVQNYQRHWLSSEGDLLLTGSPWGETLRIHFTAYHGPLILYAGPGRHLGLGYVIGSIDSQALLGQQKIIHMNGPIQINAFIPYFSDRELQSSLPPITITDQGSNLVCVLQAVHASLEDDGLLQLQIPSLHISRPDGSLVLHLTTGLLRIQPSSNLASGDPVTLAANAHFDQLKTTSLTMGPLEFKFNLSGLQRADLLQLGNTLKTLNLQNFEVVGLPLLLGFLKPNTQGGYFTQIDIHDGKIIFNGKK